MNRPEREPVRLPDVVAGGVVACVWVLLGAVMLGWRRW